MGLGAFEHLEQCAAAYASKIRGYLPQNIGFYSEKALKPGNLYEFFFFCKKRQIGVDFGVNASEPLGTGSYRGTVKNS